jgi:hypothetical protein
LGVALSGLLYFQENKRKRFDQQWIITLAGLRFIGITLLSFLLLRPILERIHQSVEKPIVVVLQDNSLSVQKDVADRSSFLTPLENQLQKLGDDVEVLYYHFDENLKMGLDSVNGKGILTAGTEAIEQVATRLSGRNVSAMVMATDGIFNKGSYPLYAAKNLNIPIFTIGLGDTSIYKDLLIHDVQCNRVCFLGNRFPVKVNIESRLAQGAQAQLSIAHKGKNITTQTVTFDSERTFSQAAFEITADEVGIQRYVVQLSVIDGEQIITNNRYEFFIQVIDDRQKINIVSHSPHPDIKALKESIEHSENYAAIHTPASEWDANKNQYGLTILHGMPANLQEQNAIKQIMAQGKPILFIWTQQTDLALFNQLNTGVNIQSTGTLYEDIKGGWNKDFTYFKTPDALVQHAAQFPPLKVPFGKITLSNDMSAQFYQKIGNLQSNQPLIAFHQNQVAKLGWIGGEGLWKWRMLDFVQAKNHAAFDEWISTWVQYLSTQQEEEKLKIITQKKWTTQQSIGFQANLYDESYQSVPNQNIALELMNEQKEKMEFGFIPEGDQYQLTIGKLPSGSYQYKAKAFNGTKDVITSGSFVVEAVQLEQLNTLAQHGALRNISYETGGEFFNKNQLDSLSSSLQQLPQLVSATYSEQSREEWIDLEWILFLLVTIFSTEWLMRKRLGSY